MSSPILNPELLRRLEQLELLAVRRSKSASKGERKSRARGLSVEFADHRNYVSGDDLRYLDWNLYGRLDKLFLKLYEEERELPVHVFLDASESMRFGTPMKFDLARQLAAALGYVALSGFDRVSVQVFPDVHVRHRFGEQFDGTKSMGLQMAIEGALRLVRGKKSALKFFHHLENLECGGTADLSGALRRGSLMARQTGVALILSDFLDPNGYESGLSALVARGFQVHAIQILAPEELNPSVFGDLRLVDAESGAEQEVTFGRYRLKAYQLAVANYVKRLGEFCTSRGISFFSVGSDVDLSNLLLKQLRSASVWG